MIPLAKLQLFSLLCFTTPLVCQGGELDLRTVAKKGSTLWLLLEDKQEQSIDMGGQTMEMGNTTTRTLQLEVKDVDDKGNLVVDVKIARIQGSMTVPTMTGIEEVEFDSAKKTEGEDEADAGGMFSPGAMTKMMTGLAGKSFVAKVDAFGKVASLEGAAELLKSTGQGPRGMGGMGGMGATTEAQLKQYVESAFGTLPQKPIAQGATWDRTDEEKGAGGRLETRLQLTLAKVEADSFEITATGTVGTAAAKADEKAGAADDQNPMREMMKNMKVKNGKISGTQRVSRQDGFVIESSNTTTMDIETPGPMGGDMTIAIKTTQKAKRTTAEAAMPKAEPKAEPKTDKGEAPKEAGR